MTRPKPNKPGAGRPPGRKSVTKSVSMPVEIWAELDKARGDVSRGAFLARVWTDWNVKCAGTDASEKTARKPAPSNSDS